MRHGISAGQLGDLDLALRDQRARDRGAEKVLALIQRVGAEHREDEIADKRFSQVVDEDFLDPEQFGLLARRTEFLALAEIGGERHDLALVGGLQPTQDNAGVEATGIGENNLFHILDAHLGRSPSRPVGGRNAVDGGGARSGRRG